MEPKSDIPFLSSIGDWVKSTFLKSPEQGASTAIYLASADAVEGVTSKYYVDSAPSRQINGKAFDEQLRGQLWDLSCEMTAVNFDVAAGTRDQAMV